MEDDLKKWKTIQSTKINLIGCDTIVNSPSFIFLFLNNSSNAPPSMHHALMMTMSSSPFSYPSSSLLSFSSLESILVSLLLSVVSPPW